MHTMHTLRKNMIEQLNDERADILADRYPEDRITEIIDGFIPVYHSHLAELLADSPSLGDGPDDSGLLPDRPTVWNIITAAVYEDLSAEAFQWLNTAQHDSEEQETAAENEAAADEDFWQNLPPHLRSIEPLLRKIQD